MKETNKTYFKMAVFYILTSFPQVFEEISLSVMSLVSTDFLVPDYLLSTYYVLCTVICAIKRYTDSVYTREFGINSCTVNAKRADGAYWNEFFILKAI